MVLVNWDCLSRTIAKKGHEVRGYDIDRECDVVKVDSTLKESVENVDIVFVAVPTPHEKEYDETTLMSLRTKRF